MKQKGFTLLEVLVALVILATALTALMLAVIESNNHVNYLKEKTAAHWVAMNVIAQTRLGLIIVDQVPQGFNGTADMLDRQWYWQAMASATPDAHTWQLLVTVAKNDQAKPISTVIGYLPGVNHAE